MGSVLTTWDAWESTGIPKQKTCDFDGRLMMVLLQQYQRMLQPYPELVLTFTSVWSELVSTLTSVWSELTLNSVWRELVLTLTSVLELREFTMCCI